MPSVFSYEMVLRSVLNHSSEKVPGEGGRNWLLLLAEELQLSQAGFREILGRSGLGVGAHNPHNPA